MVAIFAAPLRRATLRNAPRRRASHRIAPSFRITQQKGTSMPPTSLSEAMGYVCWVCGAEIKHDLAGRGFCPHKHRGNPFPCPLRGVRDEYGLSSPSVSK